MHGVYVVPADGGWFFPSDGRKESKADRHYEPTYQHLVAWLRDYRIENGVELGSPEQDILDYHQARNPATKIEPHQPPSISPPKNFRERITQWLANRYQGTTSDSLTYVPEEEAKRRAAICVNCPQNQNWKIGCPPCVDNAERIIVMMTKGHQVDPKLEGCAIAGHPNEAAVMLDEKHLKHRTNYKEELPSFCWMKEL